MPVAGRSAKKSYPPRVWMDAKHLPPRPKNPAPGFPELLWVDRLDQQGSTFTLSGRAFNDQAVSNFLANLDAVPEFEEPFLRDMQRPSGSDVFNYTINFTKITTSTEDEDEL